MFPTDPQNPIFDCGRHKPLRTRVFRAKEGISDDGKPSEKVVQRSERRPNGKVLLVVDAQGNVLPMKIHNAMSEQSRDDPYKLHQIRTKTAGNREWGTAAFLPYLQCPQQTEFQFALPEDMQTGTRCLHAEDGQAIGEDHAGHAHPCRCVAELVRRRQRAQAEVEASRDAKTTIAQAQLRASQETAQQLTTLLGKLEDNGLLEAVAARAAGAKVAADREADKVTKERGPK